MKTLPEIEAARRGPDPDEAAIAAALRDIGEQFHFLKLDATIALEHPYNTEKRGEILRYIIGHSALTGLSTSEQIQQFLRDGDRYFSRLALCAWGLAL